MKLTKAERRILDHVAAGRDPFTGGGNGQTRAVIHRLNRKGLLAGHTLTDAGRAAREQAP